MNLIHDLPKSGLGATSTSQMKAALREYGVPLTTEHDRNHLEHQRVARRPDLEAITLDPDHPSGAEPVGALSKLLQQFWADLVPVPTKIPHVVVVVRILALLAQPLVSEIKDVGSDHR